MCPSDSVHQAHSSMTESSRTRSDSLEASSSQQDRKRPRLDPDRNIDHQTDGRSEEALTDSVVRPSSQDSSISPNNNPTDSTCLTDPSSPSPANMEPSSNRPPLSKVTINTRSATANATDPSEHSNHQPSETPTLTKSPVAASPPPASPTSPEMVAVPPDTISIYSSPSQSPQIQIAVVEDIDRDPAETDWTPVTTLANSARLQDQAIPDYVKRTFPYSNQAAAGHVHDIIPDICRVFLHGAFAFRADRARYFC